MYLARRTGRVNISIAIAGRPKLDSPPFVRLQSRFSSAMASTGSNDTADDNSSGFIHFEVNVSDITPVGIFSPVIEVHGMPWKLCVKKKEDSLFMEIYLYHRKIDSNLWSVDISAEINLINNDTTNNIKRKINKTLNYDIGNWGWDNFIAWKILVNEEKGFVQDDKIIIESRFTLSKIIGIRVTPRVNFTDSNDPCHDVALLIDGKKLYVSKQILGVHSPVFKALFYGEFVEKDKKEIELKDIDCMEFIEMLNQIYPTDQKITDLNVESLLRLADRFQIKSIIDRCEQFIIDSTKLDVPSKLKLSDQFRLVMVQDHCLGTFKTAKDVLDLHKSDCYKSLSDKARALLLDKAMKLNSDA